jgi:DNA-binding transcriptional MerR regulator/methylmalonyl-CoA mutase cobalamin-binding subunit
MTNHSEIEFPVSSHDQSIDESNAGVQAKVEPFAPTGVVGIGIGIGAIANELGLTKDTLRVWERRYGFPQPLRTPGGERIYSQDQVTKLRMVKRLLDAGHRPSKVLPQSIELLEQMGDDSGVGHDAPDHELDRLVEMLRQGLYDDFRYELLKRATREGLEHFVLDVTAPLAARIGSAWAAGTLQIYQEHLFSEAMQVTLHSLMRPLIESLQGRSARPRVLLTTMPGELHGLGMLMAHAMFSLAECECTSLGTQTPHQEIVNAASAHHVDIVALSFSAAMPRQAVVAKLTELRTALPPRVAIWTGGSSPALKRKLPDGVVHIGGLAHIEETVTVWRKSATL